MNTYFIRCIQADYSRLLTLGEKLGAIQLHYTEFVENSDGSEPTPIGTPTVTATEGSWDYIGHIPQAGVVDAEDNLVFKPIADAEGNPYIHVNLATPLSLGEVAASMAGTDEEVTQALAELSKFFLLDSQGNARPPSEPFRIFAGM